MVDSLQFPFAVVEDGAQFREAGNLYTFSLGVRAFLLSRCEALFYNLGGNFAGGFVGCVIMLEL